MKDFESSLAGSSLAVATGAGIGVIDVMSPSHPVPGGWLWVLPLDIGKDVGDMSGCSTLSWLELALIELIGAPGGFGRSMDRDGGVIFVASSKYIYSFGASGGETIAFLDRARTPRRIESLRLFGDYLYLDLVSGEDPVYDVKDPVHMTAAGIHDVENWASGLKIVAEKSYLAEGHRVLIASFRKEVGWIW